MTTIANSFFGQWVINELRPFVDRGECSQVAYAITDLVRTQLHDMPAPGCAYGGPDEDYPTVSIDIFWTYECRSVLERPKVSQDLSGTSVSLYQSRWFYCSLQIWSRYR